MQSEDNNEIIPTETVDVLSDILDYEQTVERRLQALSERNGNQLPPYFQDIVQYRKTTEILTYLVATSLFLSQQAMGRTVQNNDAKQFIPPGFLQTTDPYIASLQRFLIQIQNSGQLTQLELIGYLRNFYQEQIFRISLGIVEKFAHENFNGTSTLWRLSADVQNGAALSILDIDNYVRPAEKESGIKFTRKIFNYYLTYARFIRTKEDLDACQDAECRERMQKNLQYLQGKMRRQLAELVMRIKSRVLKKKDRKYLQAIVPYLTSSATKESFIARAARATE